jgi:4-amino-4-deoxy-L-arabinose transferase-like glycosyltransferase
LSSSFSQVPFLGPFAALRARITAVDAFLGFALFLFLGTQLLLIHLPYIESDEAAFGACAARQLSFSIIPLTQCVDIKPPGIFTLYQIIYSIFGNYSSFGLRLASIVAVLGCAAAMYRMARIATDEMIAKIASATLLLIISTSSFFYALKTEIIAVTFIQLAIGRLLMFKQSSHWFNLVLAGLSLAVATTLKQPAILLFGAFSVALFFVDVGTNNLKAWIKNNIIFGVSGLFYLVNIIAVYKITDNIEVLFEQYWFRPRLYAAHGSEIFTPWQNLLNITQYISLTFILFILLIIYIIIAAIFHRKTVTWQSIKPICWWIIPCSLVVCVMISLGGHFFPSYFVFFLPFFSIIFSLYLAPALQMLNKPRLFIFISVLLSAIIAIKITMFTLELRRTLDGELKNARDVVAFSESGDKLYVWGYMPEFYSLAKMIPASRFVNTSLIVGYFHEVGDNRPPERQLKFVLPGDWDLFIKDLTQAKAFMFIDANNLRMGAPGNFAPQRYPRMKQFMDKNCTFKSNIGPLPLYRCVVKPD